MFAKIYAAVGGVLIAVYALTAFTGKEFGSNKLDDSPPSRYTSRSGGGGGIWWGGGGGYGGGK
jgi:hypothetical protein